ncbi:MAG: hypothetical protein HGB19_04985 [Chlorobiales bacterium]|nr:hypothetical protein [Chlorobiales bacterium]
MRRQKNPLGILSQLIGILIAVAFPATAQAQVYMRLVIKSENDTYTGRYEVSKNDASKVYCLYRLTFNPADTKRANPLSIAYLESGAASDNFNTLSAAEIRFRYNEKGQRIEKLVLNSTGKKKAEFRYLYKGNDLSEEQEFDTAEKLVTKTSYKRDAKGRVLETSFLNKDDKLQNNLLGYALRKYAYNEKGGVVQEDVYDAAKKKIRGMSFQYDDKGTLTESKVYDETGQLADRTLYKYNDAGRLIEKKVLNAFRYIKQRTVYAYDKQGRVSEERNFDANDNLLGDMFDVAVVKTEYDASGDRLQEDRYSSSNRLKSKVTYGKYELLQERREYGEDSKPALVIRREYDGYMNPLKESQYRLTSKAGREILEEELLYDKGQLTEKRRYDKKGILELRVLFGKDGNISRRILYDASGKIVRDEKQ